MDYLAFDLGAESGRAVRGEISGGRLCLELLHRFPNRPVTLPDGLHWNVLGLFAEIVDALRLYRDRFGRGPASVGCDSWGVDFALLDERGSLAGDPFHYRDRRTEKAMDEVLALVPAREIYRRTGIQFMPINTIYQLYVMARDRAPALETARHFLMTADLFHYFLSGRMVQEYTLASTTQLLNPAGRSWEAPLFEKLGLPLGIMPPVSAPATVIGPLREQLAADNGLGPVPVVAGACHDTAAAVAACPAGRADRFAYLSSGTWSLLGVELEAPVMSAAALEAGFTNEGALGGGIRFLRNITGLWILQQCREEWMRTDGREISYQELVAGAAKAPPFAALLDVDDPVFLAPRDMTGALAGFFRRTGQSLPPGRDGLVRVILEGLALRYARALEALAGLVPDGQRPEVLHVLGGGSRNELLNRFTASATGLPVLAGPVEATAAGNVIAQALALGHLDGPGEGRRLVRESFPLAEFVPENHGAWLEAARRLEALPC